MQCERLLTVLSRACFTPNVFTPVQTADTQTLRREGGYARNGSLVLMGRTRVPVNSKPV